MSAITFERRDGLAVITLDRGTVSDAFTGAPWLLGGVKTLSGYAMTNAGQQIAYAIFSNNLNVPAKRVTDSIDSILEAVLDDSKHK